MTNAVQSGKKYFSPGKLTFVMDAQAGSSGKARTASYLAAKYGGKENGVTFACNTLSSNAAHWTKLRDGRKYLYKALNSMAYDHERYEKFYIGPGAAIETADVLNEIEENKLPHDKLGIHPLAVVVQPVDANYEKGLVGFDGEKVEQHYGTMKTGSTCSGVGAASARRSLRNPLTVYAKDVPELKPFICDVSGEIIQRLERGESGLQEIAQGYQLSLMHPYFAPYTTYRNVTVAQALSDMMLPTKYAGHVFLNLRTFPIRINSNKYLAKDDGRHITQYDIEAGVPHTILKGDSGPWYPDQKELSWDEITKFSGAKSSLAEITSKTKLARRVATFSKINIKEAIRDNDTGNGISLALNFADYVDINIAGTTNQSELSPKFMIWLQENLGEHLKKLAIIGTGPHTEDSVDFDYRTML